MKPEEAVLPQTGPNDRSSTVLDATSSETHDGFLVRNSLRDIDPTTHRIIGFEDERQARKLIFIASESLCPRPVREATASSFGNIYAEGYPALRMSRDEQDLLLDYAHMLAHHRRYADRRYYKGCDFANFIEALAQKRAAELFATEDHEGDGPKVSASEIFVNVQPLSGAAANNAVYDAFLKPEDTILGLNLSHGGHLTHGSPANRSGKMFRAIAYGLDPKTERLDYDAIRELAVEHRPRMLVGGYSAYPLKIDWARLREIADEVDALLLADISHPSGLVAAGLFPSPVGYADVVTLTTHKTLCGPRGAIILTTDEEHGKRIDRAVFPGEQGGPHLNAIAGKAVAFLLAKSPEFRALQRATLENSRTLAAAFQDEGLRVCNGGTDSHICLVDLKSLHPDRQPLSGEIASRILDLAGITCNKNTIPGDRNAAHPTAIRFGTTWVTQRGLTPSDMKTVASVVARILKNIHPFRYANTGRGKIDMDILREATAQVAELACRAAANRPGDESVGYPHDFPTRTAPDGDRPTEAREGDSSVHVVERSGRKVVLHYSSAEEEIEATRTGAAFFELGNGCLLEVIGWRASLFLHEMLTTNIQRLGAHEVAPSAVLDRNGNLRARVTVARQEPDEHDRERYLVVCPPDADHWVKHWMRSVSDGYVLFDEDDLLAKVQGPVIVFDRTAGEGQPEPSLVFHVVGPKAGEAVASVASSLGSLEPGRSVILDEAPITALRSGDGDSYFLVTVESHAPAVVQSLKKAGALPAGESARDHHAQETGASSTELPEDLVDVTKPYFVGKHKLSGNGDLPPTTGFSFQPEEKELIQSCLYDEHVALTRPTYMVPFAGWKMPLQYTSIGEEHDAVRNASGLFDVSHMGILAFNGEHAARLLDLLTANYVHWLKDGQAQYSYLFDADGNVLDDILVYRLRQDRYMMVVNAANTDKVKAWIDDVVNGRVSIDRRNSRATLDVECEIYDLKTEGPVEQRRVDLALQGPTSLDVLRAAGGEDQAVRLQQLRRFDFIEGKIGELDALISRTGYTGEEVGFELYVRPDEAPAIWKRLLEEGAPFGIKPVGLGARDSTRAEAGLPLYGHELGGDLDLIPSEAGYGSFVKTHKPFFVGRDAYVERSEASTRVVARFQMKSGNARRIKPGDPIVDPRGQYVGVVTSSVLVQGTQQGLMCIEKKASKKGATFLIFPVPEKGRAGKVFAPGDLAEAPKGARSVLPEECVQLSRFLRPKGRLPKIKARRRRS